ncbi:MAG: (d)CMP kinase, partial [Endomicrobiales bacterium]
MFKKVITFLTIICFVYVVAGVPCIQGALDLSAIVQSGTQLKTVMNTSLPAFNVDIPVSLGRITGGNNSGSGVLVVNIQDLHCHAEVQRNISGILGYLDTTYGLEKVFVEGGYGRLDTSWLNGVWDTKLKKQVIDALLDNGRLTGSEYYSMTRGRYDILQGLEDEKLHKANIVRLGKILDKKSYYETKLSELNRDLDFMKAKYLTAENKRFNAVLAQYKDGGMDTAHYYMLLNKYIEKINRHPYQYHNILPLSWNSFPTIKMYLEVSEIQKHLHYSKVSVQLRELIEILKSHLPYSVYNKLLEKTDNLTRTDALYSAIKQMVKQYHLDITRGFPDLYEYFIYRQKKQSISPVALVQENQRMVEELRIAFSQDTAERDVSFLADFFDCFENYLLNRLSAEDYEYFQSRFEKFKQTWGKYTYKNHILDCAADFPMLDDYYSVNARRSTIFMENVLTAIPTSAPIPTWDNHSALPQATHPKVIVMISGGFHTSGVTQLLEERNISYITVTPNITCSARDANDIYEKTARYQAKLFGSQALSVTELENMHPQVTVNRRGVTIELDGGARFTINNGELTVEGDMKASAVAAAVVGLDFNVIKRNIIMMLAMISTQQTPLHIVPDLYKLINKLGELLAEAGLSGDGLMWKIAVNPDVQASLMSQGTTVEDVSRWMLPFQAIIGDYDVVRARLKSVRDDAHQNIFVRAVLSVPGFVETVAGIYDIPFEEQGRFNRILITRNQGDKKPLHSFLKERGSVSPVTIMKAFDWIELAMKEVTITDPHDSAGIASSVAASIVNTDATADKKAIEVVARNVLTKAGNRPYTVKDLALFAALAAWNALHPESQLYSTLSFGELSQEISAKAREAINEIVRAINPDLEFAGEVRVGGGAIVFKVRDNQHQGFAALKILRPSDNSKRMEKEINIFEDLRDKHIPGLVEVYKLYPDDENPAILMEWVEGETLESYLSSHQGNITAHMREQIHDFIVAISREGYVLGLSFWGDFITDYNKRNVIVRKDGTLVFIDPALFKKQDMPVTFSELVRQNMELLRIWNKRSTFFAQLNEGWERRMRSTVEESGSTPGQDLTQPGETKGDKDAIKPRHITVGTAFFFSVLIVGIAMSALTGIHLQTVIEIASSPLAVFFPLGMVSWFAKALGKRAAPGTMVVPIDGVASVGKGTIGKMVAKALGYHYLDMGSIFRLIAFQAAGEKIKLNDAKAIKQFIKDHEADISLDTTGMEIKVLWDGEPAAEDIRSELASTNTPIIAKYPIVQDTIFDLTNKKIKGLKVVIDGRNGVRKFRALIAFYLWAIAEKRAKWRLDQYIDQGRLKANGKAYTPADYPVILAGIINRDKLDINRDYLPLLSYAQALRNKRYSVIDTSKLSLDNVVELIVDGIRRSMEISVGRITVAPSSHTKLFETSPDKPSTVLVNPLIFKFIVRFPLSKVLLYVLGIIGHETFHLFIPHIKGIRAEIYAWSLTQVLPAFLGAAGALLLGLSSPVALSIGMVAGVYVANSIIGVLATRLFKAPQYAPVTLPAGLNLDKPVKLAALIADIDNTLMPQAAEKLEGKNLELIVDYLTAGKKVILISGSPYSLESTMSIQRRVVDAVRERLKADGSEDALQFLKIIYSQGKGTVTFDKTGQEEPITETEVMFPEDKGLLSEKAMAEALYRVTLEQHNMPLKETDLTAIRTATTVPDLEVILKTRIHENVPSQFSKLVFTSLSSGEAALTFIDNKDIAENEKISAKHDKIMSVTKQILADQGIVLPENEYFFYHGLMYVKISLKTKYDLIKEELKTLPRGAVLVMGDSNVDDFLQLKRRRGKGPVIAVYAGSASEMQEYPRIIVARDTAGNDNVYASAIGPVGENILKAEERGLTYRELGIFDGAQTYDAITNPLGMATETLAWAGQAVRVSPRHEYQDTGFAIEFNGVRAAGVFDGANSKRASAWASEEVQLLLRKISRNDSDETIKSKIEAAIVAANKKTLADDVIDDANGDNVMTTALPVVMVPRSNGKIRTFVASYGDCHAYAYSRGKVRMLTEPEPEMGFLGIVDDPVFIKENLHITVDDLPVGSQVIIVSDGVEQQTVMKFAAKSLDRWQLARELVWAKNNPKRQVDDAIAIVIQVDDPRFVGRIKAMIGKKVSDLVSAMRGQFNRVEAESMVFATRVGNKEDVLPGFYFSDDKNESVSMSPVDVMRFESVFGLDGFTTIMHWIAEDLSGTAHVRGNSRVRLIDKSGELFGGDDHETTINKSIIELAKTDKLCASLLLEVGLTTAINSAPSQISNEAIARNIVGQLAAHGIAYGRFKTFMQHDTAFIAALDRQYDESFEAMIDLMMTAPASVEDIATNRLNPFFDPFYDKSRKDVSKQIEQRERMFFSSLARQDPEKTPLEQYLRLHDPQHVVKNQINKIKDDVAVHHSGDADSIETMIWKGLEAIYSHIPDYLFEFYLSDTGLVAGHSLTHSLEKLNDTIDTIKQPEQISRADWEAMVFATLAHDMSYIIYPENHRINSAIWMKAILNQAGIDPATVEKVFTIIKESADDAVTGSEGGDSPADTLTLKSSYWLGERILRGLEWVTRKSRATGIVERKQYIDQKIVPNILVWDIVIDSLRILTGIGTREPSQMEGLKHIWNKTGMAVLPAALAVALIAVFTHGYFWPLVSAIAGVITVYYAVNAPEHMKFNRDIKPLSDEMKYAAAGSFEAVAPSTGNEVIDRFLFSFFDGEAQHLDEEILPGLYAAMRSALLENMKVNRKLFTGIAELYEQQAGERGRADESFILQYSLHPFPARVSEIDPTLRYERILGVGDLSVLILVTDTRDGKLKALKVPRRDGGSAALVQEDTVFNALGEIPGLVRFDRSYKSGAILMEYVKGDTLLQYRLAGRRVPDSIYQDLLRFAQAVASKGYVIGGLHDQNIMIDPDDGKTTVVDVGDYHHSNLSIKEIEAKNIQAIEEITERLSPLNQPRVPIWVNIAKTV